MNKLNFIAGMFVISTLSACGSSNSNNGGGGTTGGSVVVIPAAPGAGSGAIQASTLSGIATAVDELVDAINDDSIAAPTTAPTGQATLNGYVSVEGENEDESVLGNLTVNADFDAGTVTTTASDFEEFDFSNPSAPVAVSTLGVTGGTLNGNGTINGTTMSSTLDGTVTSTNGNVAIDGNLNGDVYDNGGTLVIFGDVSGTATDGTGTSALDGGFYVSE